MGCLPILPEFTGKRGFLPDCLVMQRKSAPPAPPCGTKEPFFATLPEFQVALMDLDHLNLLACKLIKPSHFPGHDEFEGWACHSQTPLGPLPQAPHHWTMGPSRKAHSQQRAPIARNSQGHQRATSPVVRKRGSSAEIFDV